MFTVNQVRNSRTDRYFAESPLSVPPVNQTKHPAGAMMLGVVASDGKKIPPYWFPCGLKISQEYLTVMKEVVKPGWTLTMLGSNMFGSKILPQGIRPKKLSHGARRISRISGLPHHDHHLHQTVIHGPAASPIEMWMSGRPLLSRSGLPYPQTSLRRRALPLGPGWRLWLRLGEITLNNKCVISDKCIRKVSTFYSIVIWVKLTMLLVARIFPRFAPAYCTLKYLRLSIEVGNAQ